jgi:hypothetical protein
MTPYEFWTPVVLLALAGIGVIILQVAEKRLDARLAAERGAKHLHGHVHGGCYWIRCLRWR